MCDIWAEVLKLDRVGVTDNFFELGGHSLLATRVTAYARETFGMNIPLNVVFHESTVEKLAQYIVGDLAERITEENLEQMATELLEKEEIGLAGAVS